MHYERSPISRTNSTKLRRTSRRNELSAVPRARKMIHRMQQLEAKDPVSKLSVQRQQGRQLPPQVRHGGVFRMLPTGKNSDSEEEEDYPDSNARATYAHAKFARVHHLPRRRLHSWRWSPDLSGQGQGEL